MILYRMSNIQVYFAEPLDIQWRREREVTFAPRAGLKGSKIEIIGLRSIC